MKSQRLFPLPYALSPHSLVVISGRNGVKCAPSIFSRAHFFLYFFDYWYPWTAFCISITNDLLVNWLSKKKAPRLVGDFSAVKTSSTANFKLLPRYHWRVAETGCGAGASRPRARLLPAPSALWNVCACPRPNFSVWEVGFSSWFVGVCFLSRLRIHTLSQ